MRYVVVSGPAGDGALRPVDDRGEPTGPAERVDSLAAAVAARERDAPGRWVWPATDEVYPDLLAAGVRVGRCVDLALTEGILLGAAGRWGEPRSLGAAWARLADLPVPADPPPRAREAAQQALFETEPDALPGGAAALDAAVAVHADQLSRIAAGGADADAAAYAAGSASFTGPGAAAGSAPRSGPAAGPGPGLRTRAGAATGSGPGAAERLALLVAAESACGLVAAEMTAAGLPWRADAHDALLAAALGPRPAAGLPPRRLTELADRVAAAFGGLRVNPDSPADVVQAFARAGVPVQSARSSELRRVDHPAVGPLLEYKELARLHAAHGWSWLDAWVRDGRFRPDWVVGGVVSGRWASRGGGALQIPHAVRRAVVADPGHLLVVADAAQLEPRVLAALAGDLRLAEAAAASDLYTALAADSFGGDRARAKVALLGTLYGATGGDAAPVLAVLRRRFPTAVGYVEAAARDGEAGRLVRSRLGRTCPPPSARWREAQEHAAQPGAGEPEQARARQAARDRGRFTRNFVVQASAADWAAVLLAALRRRLLDGGAPGTELVFFQHDEVVLHCPEAAAPAAAAVLTEAAEEASRLVFGPTPVRFPLGIAAVPCYADAK